MTEKDLDVAIEMCERIMEFDTRTMKDPVSENGFLFDSVYDLLKFLRPFQFATDTNVSGTDCISRSDVIALAEEVENKRLKGEIDLTYVPMINGIKALPSAQPEPLTDKEQRIFLAAMGREEKVCEEVDRNYVREPYEDSLMRVCKEIRRKVKGALWT